MKILMLTGSPHSNGTSAYLAQNYISGAEEAGHEIVRYDAAKMEIHPCIGCERCRKNDGTCVYNDDMSKIYPDLIDADRVVLVTPIYYFGMTAFLKSAIDRFYAVNPRLRELNKELDLLAVCADTDDWAMEALTAQYEAIGRYLGWRRLTPLLAYGYNTREEIEQSNYGEKARIKGLT